MEVEDMIGSKTEMFKILYEKYGDLLRRAESFEELLSLLSELAEREGLKVKKMTLK